MDRVLRVFDSCEAAEEADRDDYASLSPRECLDLTLELMVRYRETFSEDPERLERVYRVVELGQG